MQPIYRRLMLENNANKIYVSKAVSYDQAFLKNTGANSSPMTMYYDPLKKIFSPKAIIPNHNGTFYVVAPPNIVTIENTTFNLWDKEDTFGEKFKQTRQTFENINF